MRFKSFGDNWTLCKIGDLSIKVGSGSTPRGGEKVYTEIGISFIRSQNITNNGLALQGVSFIPEHIHQKMRGSAVLPNDVLLNITGASIGRSCVVPENFNEGNVNQHVCIIRLKPAFEPRFLQAYISSFKGQKSILQSQVGSGREGLNFQSIRSMHLSVPSLSEQQKITAFLTVVDGKIRQLSKKKTLLEQYKKALMQQIFSRKVRFKKKIGDEYQNWEEKKLGELLNFEQPTKYLVNDTDYDNSYAIPVLTAGKTFILGYTNDSTGVFQDELPVILFDDFTTATQFVDFPFKAKSSAMKILTAKDGVNIKFVYEAMQDINYEIGGHGRHWISVFSQIKILVPALEEQTKIANFLSAIDDKIDYVSKQIEQTKRFKRGLLQQMFV